MKAGISQAQLGAPDGSPPTLAGSLYSRRIPVQGIAGSWFCEYGIESTTSSIQGNPGVLLIPPSSIVLIAENLLA